MDLAMMQPTFLPWQGYFELLNKSDIFVFLDDFQFSVQSYHQRNRIFVNKGQPDWFTVPIRKKTSFKAPLNKTLINEETRWRPKLWRTLEFNYSKAQFFKEISVPVKQWLFTETDSLADLDISFIKMACNLLKIKCEFRLSSEYPTSSSRSQRVLDLLQWCKARRYYCAKGAFGYMVQDGIFPVKEIEFLFQDFTPREYVQVGSAGSFVPSLSIIDALMNVGPEETSKLVKGGTSKWLTWEDMKKSA